jgi:hypothetical protein
MAASTAPADLESLRDFAHDDIRDGFDRLTKHDDDLLPRAYIVSVAGFAVLLIDPRAIATNHLRAGALGAALPAAITAQHGYLAAITFTVFGSFHKVAGALTEAEHAALADGRNPDGWPPRERWRKPEEQVLVIHTAEREETWLAPIVRIHQQSPQLGYWAQHDDVTPTGGGVAAIRDALSRTPPPVSTRVLPKDGAKTD